MKKGQPIPQRTGLASIVAWPPIGPDPEVPDHRFSLDLPAPATAAAAAATAATTVAAVAAATAATATTVAAATTATVAAATAATAVATAGAGLRLEAVIAVDGTVAARFKRHFCLFAAGAAGCAEHFARTAATAAAAFGSAPACPAGRATPGFVCEPLGLVEFLLASCESEATSTIATG